MKRLRDFRVLAIDADDTLWDCQSHFEKVENSLYSLIAPYCDNPAAELFNTENKNMASLGYGCKAFTLSIIETALCVGGSNIDLADINRLLQEGKNLLNLPATPLEGVVETLKLIRAEAEDSRIVCFTKGELQDQENKLRRSGLLPFFDDVEITSDKGQAEFRALCEHQSCHPSELLMVGNSLKSDIAPALAIGAWAVYVPFHVTWQLEHTDEFDHERMVKIDTFSELRNLL